MPRILIHIPHSSTRIPDDVRKTFAIDAKLLEHELLFMTDHFTDELFGAAPAEATVVQAPVSRLVVDVERFLDPQAEPMEARGMGAVYTKTHNGNQLRRELTEQQRQELLDDYYKPHHAALEKATAEILNEHGRALVIDGHSFPSQPLLCDLNQRTPRPDICIGTDEYHTPPRLADAASKIFAAAGLSVAFDNPYQGTMVPSRWYRSESKVSSLMVELNRSLYMDESTGEKSADFADLESLVAACISAASSYQEAWDDGVDTGPPRESPPP